MKYILKSKQELEQQISLKVEYKTAFGGAQSRRNRQILQARCI
jgi:hypothetical protein